jgi:Fe(3+) dicitrate transport protein
VYPGRTHLEAIGFLSAYTEISGVCTLSGGCDPGQLDAQFNGGAATVAGLEALAGQEVPVRGDVTLGGQATYTFTVATFDTGFDSAFPQWGVVEAGDALPYVPAHQGALQVYADHEAGGGSVSARYRGEVRDVAGQGPLPGAERVPPLLLVDAAARARVSGAVSATATVTNLLGTSVTESFRPFGARPTAPRTWMLGVRAGAW